MAQSDAPRVTSWRIPDAEEDPSLRRRPCLFGLFAAPQAEAGYKHGHGWKYGGCLYLTKPTTVRVWDHYKHRYIWKTIYRDVPFASSCAPHKGCRLLSLGGSPSLSLKSRNRAPVPAAAPPRPLRVMPIGFVQHEARQQAHSLPASLLRA